MSSTGISGNHWKPCGGCDNETRLSCSSFPSFGSSAGDHERQISTTLNLQQTKHLKSLISNGSYDIPPILRAAWALVLRCYTGSDSVCFGYEEINNLLIGEGSKRQENFDNRFTVRLKLEEDVSLSTAVERAGNGTIVCADSNCLRDSCICHTAKNVAYNTVFLLKTHVAPQSFREKSVTAHLASVVAHPFTARIVVNLLPEEPSICIEWCYAEIYREFAINIAHTFDHVVGNIILNPEKSIREVDFCTERDLWQIRKWNSEYPEEVNRCIHDIVHDQVLARPSEEAVCAWDGSFTYRELYQLAINVACELEKLGVQPEVPVALCFSKSKWNIVAMLGALIAGGTFVPLDASYPLPRLQKMIATAGVNIILCSQQHSKAAAMLAETVFSLDDVVMERLASNSNEVIYSSPAKPKDAAYMIFTSGSTGEPKGTVIEHRAYCSSAKIHGPRMLINSDSRVLQFASHAFDSSLVESLTTLMQGGCTCIPSEEARINNIVSSINNMRVNHAFLTPSFIDFVDAATIPGLKSLVLMGEPMSPEHVATWSKINLVNGYGPTESSVAAVVNSQVTVETECNNIGHPVGVWCWIVDPNDHNRLMPVGCTGELLLEGPTLARCYHNDSQKTTESFIYDLPWSKCDTEGPRCRRFYKTGDLVRYNSENGSLSFVGRKDTQIKVHGQRVELGEIEHHICAHPQIKHGLVLFPDSGYCEGKMVVILSLSDNLLEKLTPNQAALNPVKGTNHGIYVTEVHESLHNRLPAYMIPSVWLCVETVPLLASGKLDRKTVRNWLGGMTEELYFEFTQADRVLSTGDMEVANDIERQLISIWSRVLSVPIDRIGLHRGFLSLGGDSITAMSCMSQCKRKGIRVTVQEVLRSKSIKELATHVKAAGRGLSYEEVVDEPFDLSPIQKLHFRVRDEKQGHFNQSFFLRLTRKLEVSDLCNAVEVLILRHSMLRARFARTGKDQEWKQRITKDISTSYRFRAHDIHSASGTECAIAESQTCLDAIVGPLLAFDLFNIEGQDQLISMIGHHLVIDLVSWRVILEELEELLMSSVSSSLPELSLPFQTWCRLQYDQCTKQVSEKYFPGKGIPQNNFRYWGMEDCPNLYGDVISEGFEIDSTITSLLLTECHKTLRTELVDILLASLLHTFSVVFSDRSVPAIYNESHGREPWDLSIDISRTVGWFTALYPIFVNVDPSDSIIQTLIQIKDLRRRIPDSGRTYFAAHMLNDQKVEKRSHQHPMELLFNYLGRYQQLERNDALFRPVDNMAGETRGAGGAADVGESTPRFGLFEISAVITQNKLRFSFTFNRLSKHQAKIRDWISQSRQALCSLSPTLISMKPQLTLSDFPLLALNYRSLKTMIVEKLPQIGIMSMEEIEDAYPCSSMQQGIIFSQMRNASYYKVCCTYEVQDKANEVDIHILSNAWESVVKRHGMLRTIFVENLTEENMYSQIVLRNLVPEVSVIECEKEIDVLEALDRQDAMEYSFHKPMHRLTLCRTSTSRLFFRLEISHAIMDGASISIIMHDLELAYEGSLVDSLPPFSSFVSYLQGIPQEGAIKYWSSYLAGVEPCHLPSLNDGKAADKKLRTLRLPFNNLPRLQLLCEENGLTMSNVFHTAWSLTLSYYCGSDEVCFGYLSSLRDAPIDDLEEVVGPAINMLPCRVKVPTHAHLNTIMTDIQKDYSESLPHRYASLADVQHALQLSNISLFDTCLSYRKLPTRSTGREHASRFSQIGETYDPTEYLLSLNIESSDDGLVIDMDFWTDAIVYEQAANIGQTFLQSLQNILNHPTERIGTLGTLSDHHKRQIATWNLNLPFRINDCIHEIIEREAKERPESQAICAWDEDFTYAQLNGMASKLADHLIRLGVVAETLVPLCFDKSAWTIISMLAVLKAGGGCVPLDATHPKSVLHDRILDVGARVIITSPGRAHLFEDIVPHVVSVSRQFMQTLPVDSRKSYRISRPSNTAFIIFTSGSTGKPKGVVLEHSAFVTSATFHGSALGMNNTTRSFQFSAYTFDLSLEEIFTTLLHGGCVCVPSDHDRMNNLAAAINALKANFVDLTPTVASLLNPDEVPCIKKIAVGGEPLTKEVRERWARHVPLHNVYGPSECSVNCTLNPNAGNSEQINNIGRSIGSISWVVDPMNHDILLPIGCSGELLIEGPILARGYLNSEDKTKESFIKSLKWRSEFQCSGDLYGEGEHSESSTRRMYKTGDLVRYNSDGSLVYLGRKDTQVKLSGQRIELGEVEHHIKSGLPVGGQVAVDLVSVRNGKKNGKALAAFVFSEDSCGKSHKNGDRCLLPISDTFRSIAFSLQSAVSSSLPAYMVPRLWIPIAYIPFTVSGKLDRRRLRELTESLSVEHISSYRLDGKSERPPSTLTEILLQQLWASVLDVDSRNIGADDTFFKHGGDSVGAIRLVTAAREVGLTLTVADIFQEPKLSEMARNIAGSSHILSRKASSFTYEPFSILPDNVLINQLKEEIAGLCQVDIEALEDLYPCTPIQEGLISLTSKQPGAYITRNIYCLPKGIDIKRFKRAWEDIWQSQVILRTRVVHTRTSGFVQAVLKQPLVWGSVRTIDDLPETSTSLPFSNGGSLSQYTIVGGKDNSTHFAWTMHHALYDGWSIPVLLDTVEKLYNDLADTGHTVTATYPLFIKFLSGIDMQKSDDFWSARLADPTSTQFPQLPYQSYPVQAKSYSQRISRIYTPSGSDKILSSLLRAAWALTLSVFSCSDDVIFGEILTGRDAPIPGITEIIGPVMTTIPSRVSIDRDASVKGFLEQVQKQLADTLPYQFAGLQHIKRLSTDASVACDFQNILTIEHEDESSSENMWNLLANESSQSQFFTYPLNITCKIGHDKLVIQANYDEDVISTIQTDRLLSQFETFLEKLCSKYNQELKIGQLEFLGCEDLESIQIWNSKPLEPIERCIHDLVRENAYSHPEDTAVFSWDVTLTYHELDQMSTLLAHRISEYKPVHSKDWFIPMCFQQSGLAIIAMLAILKAGAAFVPLDPRSPSSRLREIVRELGSDFTLCSDRYEHLCRDFSNQVFPINLVQINALLLCEIQTPLSAPNHAAYIVFTSGTTGKPKGIIIEHAGFCSGASKQAAASLITRHSRVLQFASYTFDASLIEILTTLLAGGCVCVPDEDTRLNALGKAINEMEVTTALLTPSVAQLITPSEVPGLRTLVLVGEPMSQTHISTWAHSVVLVNGYGPSECSVAAAFKTGMTAKTDPANLGSPVDTCWIVDPNNHHRLMPVGCIGELVIEGRTVGRGYLNNEVKTVESFIYNPGWPVTGIYPFTNHKRRVYKTGDLVKYAPDYSGEILYVGRKDNQAKLHGQRVELEEVEHYISGDSLVQHVLVTLPKLGPCAGRLVAALSLRQFASSTSSLEEFAIINTEAVSSGLSDLRRRLEPFVPPYMIPSNWVVLKKLPLMASGKLDRKVLARFVERMDDDTYQRITSFGVDRPDDLQRASVIEHRLMKIWGDVLNLPLEKVGLSRSFIHLGGDSISAMQVMSKCRSEDLAVTVKDIMASRSISELAPLVSAPEEISCEDGDDEEFDLSPIQRLYFLYIHGGNSHFNQSMMLQVRIPVSSGLANAAFEFLVKRHLILRTRFTKAIDGIWRQRIPHEMDRSYCLSFFKDTEDADIERHIESTQKSLDIVKGPLIAAALFETSSKGSILFITAHHLVVDIVSWRIIIEDLENFLRSTATAGSSSISFRTWSRLQSENTKKHQSERPLVLDADIPVGDFDYWGMQGYPNLYGDVTTEETAFEYATSQELLKSCHTYMRTDIVDVILAGLLLSFATVFIDRERPPAIYNEGHGRETWHSSIDPWRTVGWFTTLSPVHLPKEQRLFEDGDLVKCIRWIKDLRHRTPDKGRQYFSRRFLTGNDDNYKSHWPMEILFNYLGQFHDKEHSDTLLQPLTGTGQSINMATDIGYDVPRFALIEISVIVHQGSLAISFSYNKFMKRQNDMKRWFFNFAQLLRRAPEQLMLHGSGPTLSDFPLLPLSYDGIDQLSQHLASLGISSLDEIENVFPCSPMQQGMLLTQLRDPQKYAYIAILEIRSPESDKAVSIERLENAWKNVVQRHQSLRTVFIESTHGESLMDQVVLRDICPRMLYYNSYDTEAHKVLSDIEFLDYTERKPAHRLSICKTTSNRIFCRLDLSHAICDGSSMPLLLRDLSDAYMKMHQNGSLGPVYSDFILYLQSGSRTSGIAYWKEYLDGIDPCIFPSLCESKTKNRLRSRVLEFKRTSELQEFCRDRGVTISNLLQLVWGLVLRCYTGCDDVCFGYLTSGRDIPVSGIQDAVGAFINMLICRLKLNNEVKLIDVLLAAKMDFVRSMEHQSVSLAEVQHELGLSETPLFNTVFTYQRRQVVTESEHKSLLFDILEVNDPSEYMIAVNVEASDLSTEVHFSYWSNDLSDEHAEYIADTFESVLNDILDHTTDRTIGTIGFASPRDYQSFSVWNDKVPEKIERCVHELIREQALLRPPSTPAVCAWDASFTYLELEELSMALANHLRIFGVQAEVFVPLCFEKSAWTIVAQLAVLKAGGAFVSLDPSHPEKRLRSLVEDVGDRLVLCSSKYEEKARQISKLALVVNRQTIDKLKNSLSPILTSSAKPTNAAYIIFTSGSTGKPKGTVIEHAAISTNSLAFRKALHMNSMSRVFQFASYTFDASVMEILSTLVSGGCICVPSDEDRLNDIAGAIRRLNANWAFLTPAVGNTINPEEVPNLETLVAGGEAMPEGFIEKWAKNTCLINGYGPTECTILCVTDTKVDLKGTIVNHDCRTIGRVVSGRSWITDSRNYNRLMPVGAIGELVLEGCTIARGYLNNEVKTKEVFIQNPEWVNHCELQGIPKPKGPMYRTGDLVRHNLDGSISYLSRIDTQVKLNGQRVELGEIEYQCRKNLPNQSQVTVDLVVDDKSTLTKKLAVFFTVSPKDKYNHSQQDHNELNSSEDLLLPMTESIISLARELRDFLTTILPTYMIPKLFFPVSDLPWASSGKLDRSRLRNIVQSLSREGIKPYTLSKEIKRRGARTNREKVLQALWEKVLGLSQNSVNADDNFFELGGDSLAAIRLIVEARLQRILLRAVNVFRYPVLTDMAVSCEVLTDFLTPSSKPFSLLQTTTSMEDILREAAAECQVDRGLLFNIYPCSPLQEGLTTLSVKKPGAYVAQFAFRLCDTVDIERFKYSWQQTVNECDILRTRIVHTSSMEFLQVVTKESPISWRTAASFQEVGEETAIIPQHNGAPLTQFTMVIAAQSAERYFVLSIHHVLYDGWSLGIILRRVEDIYFQKASQPAESSYTRFIDYLFHRDTSTSDTFWRSYLANISPVHFPQTTGSMLSEASPMRSIKSSKGVSYDSLRKVITVAELVRAAWAISISSHTGSNDVCFGETLTGRNSDIPNVSDIIGPVLTTIPTRIIIDPEWTIPQYLQKVHRITTDIIPHQHSGLQSIRRLDEDTSIACDFQNLLITQTSREGPDDSLWKFEALESNQGFFTYPLVVECDVSNFGVEITFHYNEAVMSSWQTERLLHQFQFFLTRLTQLSQDHSSKLSDLESLSPEDVGQIAQWNRLTPWSCNKCIHELFRQRYIMHPAAPAISAWDGDLTYQELAEHASKFASYLTTFGVGPEVFVPVCLDKSVWTTVILLGVLMAGGAFVPLDPGHPITRHLEILEELEAEVMICSPRYSNRYKEVVTSCIEADGALISRVSETKTIVSYHAKMDSSNAAYVIFTSGTTGRPKGIIVEHSAFTSSSMAFAPMLSIEDNSRVLQFASLSFDAAVMEIFTTLICGGCICVPSEDQRLTDISGVIQGLRVSWALLTPSVARMVNPATVPCLNVLVCGGEPLSSEVITRWVDSVKLINAYGPTESAVVSTVNTNITSDSDPHCIGRGTQSTTTWVLSIGNHDNLAPLGAVGELALEGPALARGYLRDRAKTTTSFVENPSWTEKFPHKKSLSRRIYKTGDLVRYDADGSLEYIGRKDSQVKVNGQRMDLGEIEHRLTSDDMVHQVIVLLPNVGYCQRRIVAVLALNGFGLAQHPIADSPCELLSENNLKAARCKVDKIRNFLAEKLPHYMVPHVWVVVETMPMLVSGKLDRRKVSKFIENMSEDTYKLIMNSKREESNKIMTKNMMRMEEILWDICAEVLNLPSGKVRSDQSFLSLGGDSISAMSVMARARKQKLHLTLNSILRSTSISKLALSAGSTIANIQQERVGKSFGLSPIQSLYVQSAQDYNGSNRFNQSFTVRLTYSVEPHILEDVIRTIIKRHSMLRARFSKAVNGVWQQTITNEVDSSYRYRVHHTDKTHEMWPLIANSQECVNIFEGPIFAADLFAGSNSQFLFMVASHLCIDMVSWRIILQDLQDLMESVSLPVDLPLSFQTWSELRSARNKEITAKQPVSFKMSPTPLDYWGMEGPSNIYSDAVSETFSLDETTTTCALEECHKTFRTEPVDLFLSVILHSFRTIFSEREFPILFNEGHGRESWDPDVDPSTTVGWFTTIYPLKVASESGDIFDILKRVKDRRRKSLENDQACFEYYLSPSETRSDAAGFPIPMEVLFNYLGRVQQLEREGSLFQHMELPSGESVTTGDLGPSTVRLALFEISAIVIQGRLQFSFTYNRRMKRGREIRRWVSGFRRTLEETAVQLKERSPEPTLSDYPLLPLTYDNLRVLVKDTLPKIGIINLDDIEDIYPSSPVQEGILLSQIRDKNTYFFHVIFELRNSRHDLRVECKRLKEAWQKVVIRHSSLRTTFVDSVHKDRTFDQIVMKRVDNNIKILKCEDSEAIPKLRTVTLQKKTSQKRSHLPHLLTICTTSKGRILVKMEINHAVIDGASVPILLRDLGLAYLGQLPDEHGPLYSDYIRYITTQSQNVNISFWKRKLQGLQPCYLPKPDQSETKTRKLATLEMQFNQFHELQELCEKNSVTLASVMQAAWALVLREYTQSEEICFGYLSTGRDAPVDGIHDAVGTFINMLCCRVKLETSQFLEKISRNIQEDYIDSVAHQHCSLAQVQHELGLTGKALFNTAVSIQNHSRKEDSQGDLIFDVKSTYDPSEYSVTLNIETARGEEGVLFAYWTDFISNKEASGIASRMAAILTEFVNNPGQTIGDLDISAKQKGKRPQENLSHSDPTPSSEGDTGHKSFDLNDPALQELVDKRVREVITQLLKDCTLSSLLGQRSTNPESYVDVPYPEIRSVQDNLSISESEYSSGSKDVDLQGPLSQFSQERSSELENTLLSLWCSLLDLTSDSINKDDSFFDLGGDSILAMRLVGAAREEGLTLTVADVFRNPVFEDMLTITRITDLISTYSPDDKRNSAVVDDLLSPSVGNKFHPRFSLLKAVNLNEAFLQSTICPKVGVFRGGIADVLPVTDFQALAIAGARLESRWMLNYFSLNGQGPLDLKRLKESCSRVVDAFDILRTVFVCSGGHFVQVILRKFRPEFSIYEAENTLEEFITTLRNQDGESPLRQGEPFVRFSVVREKASDRHCFLIRLSHAQYDGVSLPKILSAIRSGYEGGPIPSTRSFADYVRASAETITADHYDHWKSFLKDVKMTEIIPHGVPNYNRSSSTTIDLRKIAELQSVAHGSITIATIIKSAWALTLARISSQPDVVFGHTISGRNVSVPGVETMVGPCLNIVPVRVIFQDGWTGLDLLRHVQDQQVSHMPYEALGFREIIKRCTDWPDWTYFTSTVQHQNMDQQKEIQMGDNEYTVTGYGADQDFSDFAIVSTPLEAGTVKITLSFSIRNDGNDKDSNFMTTSFAERVLDMLCTTAHILSNHPTAVLPTPTALSDIPSPIKDDKSSPLSSSFSEEAFLSTHLKDLRRPEIVVLSDILTRTWRQVLTNHENNRSPAFQLETSFFDIGGDIVALAQVAWLLDEEGFHVRVEDLIEHPTLLGQIAVVNMCRDGTKEKENEDKSNVAVVSTEDTAVAPAEKKREKRKTPWVRAMKLVKRVVRRDVKT